MTPERLKQLRAMCEKASPAPWFFAYRAIHSKPLSDEYMRIERELGTAGADDDDPRWETQPESAIMFVPVVGGDTATAQGAANGTFAAESRTAIPELLDEVDRWIKYKAHLDEEYATMQSVLRAEHQECQRLRAALAAMTAARDEACDIADRRTFTPTFATAAQPHFSTAQPLNAGETFKLIPGTGNACAAVPPALGQVFTIDTGAPHRDKARIAELRKAGGK